jgi:acylglycerol lipase
MSLMNTYTHNTGTFIGKGGTEIFFQNWIVDNPRGILVIAHGVGEHSGRYENIISELEGSRISIYALDHRGHGRSGGKRGHIDSFMDYVYDLKLFIDLIKEEHVKAPLILLGHSMGGVIANKYALTYPDDLNGIVLSSPGLVPTVKIAAWKLSMANAISKYLPELHQPTNLDTSMLSHDSNVIEAYENDRLVHRKVTARWFTEFMNACKECLRDASQLNLPILVFHGKEDKIVNYQGSERVFHNATTRIKELYLFEGLYHETMNELEKKKVLSVVVKWIQKTIGGKKIAKHTKKNVQKKPIIKVKRKSAARAAKNISRKSVPLKKGTKKQLKKGVKKIVGTTKKTAKKAVKKAAKKSAKKTTKKKK